MISWGLLCPLRVFLICYILWRVVMNYYTGMSDDCHGSSNESPLYGVCYLCGEYQGDRGDARFFLKNAAFYRFIRP
jgi:hypothetical protein